ncbi:MAG: hypothetical protein EOM88_04050 [Clostridia bacterium]|nr:hypothetical protein [Clostridia bacterium]
MQYIYKEDSEKRALNYRAFSAKELLNRAEMYEGNDERIKKEIPRIKERAEKYSPSGNNSNHWDGLSTKKIMFDLGLDSMYQNWYVRMSSYIHPQYRGGKIKASDKGEYIKFLNKMVFKDLNLPILESLRAVNKKFDLLEGAVIISNYPKEKATLVFSINEHREPKRP